MELGRENRVLRGLKKEFPLRVLGQSPLDPSNTEINLKKNENNLALITRSSPDSCALLTCFAHLVHKLTLYILVFIN